MREKWTKFGAFVAMSGLALAGSADVVDLWRQPDRMPRSSDYRVSVDGASLDILETPLPQNRLRPEERAPYSYGVFGCEGAVTVDVELISERMKLGAPVVSPDRLGIAVATTGSRRVRFTLPGPGNYVFEPDGRHRALVLSVFPPRKSGEPMDGDKGVVYVRPGVHRRPLTRVGAGETLYLAEGAILEGGVRLEGDGARLCGRGIVSGAVWPWRQGPKEITGDDYSCHMVHVTGRGVEIRDVTIWSSWTWTLALDSVTNAVVDNVKILGGRVINDDGIDICRARDVVVKNSFVRSQDDSIAVKWWCENAMVTNCILWSDSANIARIGWECEKPPRRIDGVSLVDCDIQRLSLRPNKPTDFWCNAAFLVQAANGATISNVLFDSCRFHALSPGDIFVAAKTIVVDIPECRETYRALEPGHVRGVRVQNIRLPACVVKPASLLESHDGRHLVENVCFENVTGHADPVRVVLKGGED